MGEYTHDSTDNHPENNVSHLPSDAPDDGTIAKGYTDLKFMMGTDRNIKPGGTLQNVQSRNSESISRNVPRRQE